MSLRRHSVLAEPGGRAHGATPERRPGRLPPHAQPAALHDADRHRGRPHGLAGRDRARTVPARGASPLARARFPSSGIAGADPPAPPRPSSRLSPQFELEEQLSLFIKDEVYHMSNVLQRRPLDDLGFRQLIADNVEVFTNRVKVMSCQYERERVSPSSSSRRSRIPAGARADPSLPPAPPLRSKTRVTSRSPSRSSASSTRPRTATTSRACPRPGCPSSDGGHAAAPLLSCPPQLASRDPPLVSLPHVSLSPPPFPLALCRSRPPCTSRSIS